MSTVLVLPFATRPPCLAPRPRRMRAEVARRIRAWASAALGTRDEASITVREWVSLDSRTTPHAVAIVHGTTVLWLHKASERIDEHDVRRAAAGMGARTIPTSSVADVRVEALVSSASGSDTGGVTAPRL